MIKNITYENKEAIQNNPDLPEKNMITDSDMNEIKEVVNNNAQEQTIQNGNIEDKIDFTVYETGIKNNSLVWELGGIDTETGLDRKSSTLIRTNFISCKFFNNINIEINNSYNLVLFYYDENYKFLKLANSKNTSNQIIPFNKNTNLINEEYKYFRIILAKPNYGTGITIEEGKNINVKLYYNYNLTAFKNSIIQNNSLIWELGGIDLETGLDRESPTLIRTNFVSCKLGKILKTFNLASSIMIFFYDKNKKFIKHTEQIFGKGNTYNNIEENMYYFRIILNNNDISLDSGNLCNINLIKNTIFTNKKISILGDSISSFDGISPSDKLEAFYPKGNINNSSDTYWGQIITELGANLEVNNSYSSSTVCSPNTQYSSFCDENRLTSLGNPDIIIVEGGTNDIYSGKNSSKVNTYKIETYNTNNFSEAYSYVIRKLQTLYTNAKIICLTPNFIWNEGDYSGRTHCTFERINDICDNIITLSNHFGAIPIDLRKAGINYSNILSCTVDGLHWNKLGHSLVANYILSNLIK